MYKKYLLLAAFSGFLAVILGAFGAHGLKNAIDTTHLGFWKTGNEYHFYHTLAVLALALSNVKESRFIKYAVTGFLVGIILFSGSLYLMATNVLTGIDSSILGPITPIGGVFFLAGWVCLLIEALKAKDA